MVRATLLFTLATAASAAKLTAFKGQPRNQKNLLPIGLSNEALNLGMEGTCSSFQKVCDVDFCIPTLGTCCSEGNGAYCELGKTCVENGCCPIGQTCTGPPTCEDDDEKICGTFCIPNDADCCDSSDGYFCDSPGTCTSSGCSVGSLRGGPGGSGGSGGSGGGGSGGSGGSGDSGGGSDEQCYSFQEECGTGCMPKGNVCCANGLEYCLSGQICNNDGTCRRGGLGGSGGSSDDDDTDGDSISTTSSTSTSTTTSFDISSLPTGPVSGDGGDDSDSNGDSSSDSNSNGNSNDAPSSGGDSNANDNSDQDDAAMVHGPSLFAAVVALIPLLL